ncbi:MAG: phage protease [Roseococcus sp.]
MAAPSTAPKDAPALPAFEIFRAGTHTDMGGRTLSFTAADIAAMAAAYDPAQREAPLVVGHPSHDAPAYGWVAKLEARGDTLLAHPDQTDPAFAEMVKAGRFKHRSVMLLPPGAAGNPSSSAHYVKHVGFLGAQAPAVQGLKPISFAAEEEAVQIGFMEPWQVGSLARMLRGLREWFIAEKGTDTADQVLPSYAIEDLEAAARAAPPAVSPAFTEPNPSEENTVPDTLAEREAALAAEATRLQAEGTRLAAQALAFAEREAADRAREDGLLLDGLVAEGRLLPALRADTLAFMAALPVGEATFAFAEGQPKQTPHAAFRELLGKLPKIIPFGTVAGGEGIRRVDRNNAAEIQREAAAFMEREARDGRTVTITQAVAAVTQGEAA